jgi:shikimate dehydrogenase
MAQTYTLDDLEDRARLDAGHVKPARLAVIGSPVEHSASPRMHQAALDEHMLDVRYIRVEVAPTEVAEAFRRMAALGFIGANVTVPHKFEALAVCHEVSQTAQALGAVNTVTFDAGRFRGDNTDGPGFVRAIREDFGVHLQALRVLIVGAGGGAGKAISTQCALEGCKKLVLVNRGLEKVRELAATLQPCFHSDRLEGPGSRLVALGLDDPRLREEAAGSDLLVNLSSLGLKHGDPSPLPELCFQPYHLVYDSIYQPPRTRFLKAAAEAGARVANGSSLLIHQGALAFEIWFPLDAPLAAMRRGLQAQGA